MKTVLKIAGALIALLLLGAGGGFVWAKGEVSELLAHTPEVHDVDFPIPFPLEPSELAALKADAIQAAEAADEASPEAASADAGVMLADAGPGEEQQAAVEPEIDADAIARERALERGAHLVKARYVCIECHGKDFAGGVMVDDPAMGQLLGPNITGGKGGKTANYSTADWDHIVRHGIKPDGTAAVMPSDDFKLMSDQELSDIILYVRSQPPVDAEVPPPTLGPLGTVLAATGKLPLSAFLIEDHKAPHARLPPQAAPSAEFGKHLMAICTGCHRPNLEGGPIAAGPPDWAPAGNLTPHADGLETWTFEQFESLMREGIRPDGRALKVPMTLMMPYAQRMTATEMQALWEYMRSVPPLPTGK